MNDDFIQGVLDNNLYEDAPLKDHFRAESHGNKWHMFCKNCGKGWSLVKQTKGMEYHPGNLLHLLNHAYSHKSESKKKTKNPGTRAMRSMFKGL